MKKQYINLLAGVGLGLILSANSVAATINTSELEGQWRYDPSTPAAERLPETLEMKEKDGNQRARPQCAQFDTLMFSEATGAEIAEDLAEQMPEVLAFSDDSEFADYADFSKRAAKWFKPNENYTIAAWNCGEVGGNYYFLNKNKAVATSAGVKESDTFVVEINK